ncbi:hypothetical protein GCM10022243_53300 [Saccharothrix violaceirubra]|uniref:Heme-degrading monooxygenase HmoA n=1 Tax=Saccharothrix violaceirubra TaxID=413306 RepID=A0A7W7WUH5_9PSEU|nr:antibiotic biosynthesis monooxygenase family protein [Saccharothrix violaceirubra]MBB4963393.1 heme-degrading monooxygenase HmoA [Saccharothrix violaceirubra]
MIGSVRVFVYYRGTDGDAVRAAYREASAALRGVPGLISHELLESAQDPTAFVVASSWTDFEAFGAWERGNDHRAATAPLRKFRDGRLEVPFAVYRVDRPDGGGY